MSTEIDSLCSNMENYKKEIEDLKNKLIFYKNLLKSNKVLSEKIKSQDLEMLSMFMAGKINFAVDVTHGVSRPIAIHEVMLKDRRENISQFNSGIKLLSIFGNYEGDLSYMVSVYEDHYGASREFKFFENYEDAIKYIKDNIVERASKDEINADDIRTIIDLKLMVNDDRILNYIDFVIKENNDAIQNNLVVCNKELENVFKEEIDRMIEYRNTIKS